MHTAFRMPNTHLLVLLITYNESSRISRCLDSLVKQDINFACVISDNKSTDGTFEYLKNRLKGDSRFHLIQTTKHCSLYENLQNAYQQALNKYDDIKYTMLFAADDQLIQDNYLSTLSNWLDKNISFQAVAPKILNYNFRLDETTFVKPSLTSRIPILRVLKWGTRTSKSGFTNFICGLIRHESYINFQESLMINVSLESSVISARAIRAEFITYLQFVMYNRVGNCNLVELKKEIHNRIDPNTRINIHKVEENQKSIISNFKYQIQSMTIPIKGFSFFYKNLLIRENIFFATFALLYFFTNFSDLIRMKSFKIITSILNSVRLLKL